MKSLLFKFSLLAFFVFAVTVLAGKHLNPVYELFGNVNEIRSIVTSGSLVAGIAAIGLIIVRTILGIIAIIILALAIYFVLKFGLLQHFFK